MNILWDGFVILQAGKYVNVDGIECLNFATHNYLGFIGDENIEKKALKTIEKYGVGSCGPRGFYGTTGMHIPSHSLDSIIHIYYIFYTVDQYSAYDISSLSFFKC